MQTQKKIVYFKKLTLENFARAIVWTFITTLFIIIYLALERSCQ